MNVATRQARLIRAAVFRSPEVADAVVGELQAAGFGDEEITVVSSNDAIERQFRRFEHQDPAGRYTPAAAFVGGACGASLAGFSAIALARITSLGGIALLAAAGVAIWAGGVVGGLIGSMLTRGVEREMADYYDQAVEHDRILVAVEVGETAEPSKLARAEAIFAAHGAEPLPLEAS